MRRAAALRRDRVTGMDVPAGRHRARGARPVALVPVLILLAGLPALAQTPSLPAPPLPPPVASPPPPPPKAPPPPSPDQLKRLKLNRDTLIVAASRPGASHLAIANDLAAAVASGGGDLRLLPIAAEGGLANLRDLVFLRGVDMAIVAANELAHAKASNALGPGLTQRLAYVASLYGEEVHILAGRGIASIEDLRGRKIAVPPGDTTGAFTVRDILERLGVAVESVPMEAAEAVEAVRSGTVAGAVLVAGKPARLVSGLPKDGSLRLLSLPLSAQLGEGYSPAVLLAEDYPALIPPGAIVETVAVRAILLANSERLGEERARRIARHVPALFDAISGLAVSQGHTKWKDVNLGAVLPGWRRVPAADLWLGKASEQQRHLLTGQFDDYLRARKEPQSSELPAVRRRKLFQEFQAWARKSLTSETTPQ